MKTAALFVVLSVALAGGAGGAGVYEPAPPSNPHAEPRPECNVPCTRERVPVCAADSYGKQRTYQNECLLGYLNCKEKTNFVIQSKGECPDDPLIYVDDEQSDTPSQNELEVD